MAVSYAELKTPVSKDAELETLLKLLALAGFPARSWHSGSVPRSLAEMEAETLAELNNVIADIARGGFLDDATGDWLTALAKSVFDEDRVEGVKTQGDVVLTCAAGAGPYAIGVGTFWVTDASGKRFVNVTGGTLPDDDTLTLRFEAEAIGAEYNLPGGVLTIPVTPLAGVTVNNPDVGGTWITQTGADEESDEELRARCRAKWATLGTGATTDSYTYWATTADAEVRRVNVLEHSNLGTPADGHVTLYLAGDGGAVSGDAVTAVIAYIASRRPLCTTVHVASASAVGITVTATQYVEAAKLAAAQAEVASLFTALNRELAIGAVAYRAEVIERLMTPAGMRNTVVASPAGDTALDVDEVAQFTLNLTWVMV